MVACGAIQAVEIGIERGMIKGLSLCASRLAGLSLLKTIFGYFWVDWALEA